MNATKRRFAVIALALGLAVFAVVMIVTNGGVAAATVENPESSSTSMDTLVESDGTYAEGVIEIALGDTVTISGEGAAVDGDTVRITAAGVYSLSGTLADGCIDIDAKGKVYLEFGGVDITSGSGPALIITDAKKVTLTLVEGTTNRLTDSPSDSADDAALFTNDTLVINGGGTLIVTGNNAEGISSDDDIIINNGTVIVTAADDGLNAHDDITINDGEVYIFAGGDGVDSNGTININGGTIVSYGSAAGGDGGLDAIADLTISGGILIAGGNSIAVPGDGSTQGSIYVATGATQAAGTGVRVMRDNEEVMTFTLEKECQNLLLSSSSLISGETYQVQVGGTGAVLSVIAAATPADSSGDQVSAPAQQ